MGGVRQGVQLFVQDPGEYIRQLRRIATGEGLPRVRLMSEDVGRNLQDHGRNWSVHAVVIDDSKAALEVFLDGACIAELTVWTRHPRTIREEVRRISEALLWSALREREVSTLPLEAL